MDGVMIKACHSRFTWFSPCKRWPPNQDCILPDQNQAQQRQNPKLPEPLPCSARQAHAQGNEQHIHQGVDIDSQESCNKENAHSHLEAPILRGHTDYLLYSCTELGNTKRCKNVGTSLRVSLCAVNVL